MTKPSRNSPKYGEQLRVIGWGIGFDRGSRWRVASAGNLEWPRRPLVALCPSAARQVGALTRGSKPARYCAHRCSGTTIGGQEFGGRSMIRKLTAIAAVAAAFVAAAPAALGQDYPNRLIKIIQGF